jgi:hypothetical protein
VGKRLLIGGAIALLAAVGTARSDPTLTGAIRSDYYLYQDATKQNRFAFTETVEGRLAPASWSGWAMQFIGELRDANDRIPGKSDDRLLGLSLNGRMGPAMLALGRISTRAPAPTLVDGLQAALPLPAKIKLTVAGGREVYSLYRMDKVDLPERYRASELLEGSVFGKMKWQVDQLNVFRSGKIDDQTVGLGLRCRRFTHFGWDARFNFDLVKSTPRDLGIGFRVVPMHDLRFDLRYTERRMHLYKENIFSRFDIEPTRLASLTARYHLTGPDLWLGLGYSRRLRDAGDLDRVQASVSNDMGEIGVRYQMGTGMKQVGGWLEANGKVIPHLGWTVSADFDRWDSAWDAEPTEAWANSAGLEYELSEFATLSGRVEHYRDQTVKSDIRGLLTFNMRYGI